MGTKTTLIEDLRKRPPSRERDMLIDCAAKGLFHDFESPLATPKMELVRCLKEVGYHDLARQALHGVYDDAPTAENLADLLADLLADRE